MAQSDNEMVNSRALPAEVRVRVLGSTSGKPKPYQASMLQTFGSVAKVQQESRDKNLCDEVFLVTARLHVEYPTRE